MTKVINTIATRIQARLKRRNIINITLADIREKYLVVVADQENPTETEISEIVGIFEKENSLPVLTTNYSETENLAGVPDIWEEETEELELEPELAELVLTEEVSNEVSNNEYLNEAAIDTEVSETSGQITHQTKSELVANTAGELGFTLNSSEIEAIAQNVNYSSDDLQDSLEEIKGAIIAFIRHKFAVNSQVIDEALEEISQVAAVGFEDNSRQLTEGLQGINAQLQGQSRDFKSKVRSTLSAFAIPDIKAS